MAKGIIDPKLAEPLRANPNVERAASRTVVFKPSFIEHVLYQYLRAGKARVEIFGGAGIDVDALGRERLKTVLGNWLAKHKCDIPIGMLPGRKKKDDRRSYVERLDDELAWTSMLQAVVEEPRKEKDKQCCLPRSSGRAFFVFT